MTRSGRTIRPVFAPWLRAGAAISLVACHAAGPADSAPPPSGACPVGWLDPPSVDPSIAVPTGGGHVVLHARANGTQNYACSASNTDGGATYAWTLKGPEAVLSDCRSTAIGHHFASEAGPPEWQLADGTFVVAHKTAALAAADAAPWLLLTVDRQGGSGPLAGARYVQRVGTRGGAAPGTPCDASQAGALQKVPYEAHYYFFAP
jgi:hypothetical protein